MSRRTFLNLALVVAVIAGLASPSLAQEVRVRVVSLTSPVSPGQDATIVAQTAPNADCRISVVYKSGPSRASGLYPKAADRRGVVRWTWRVGTRTTPGRWPIIITCSIGGREGTLRTSFDVL